MGKLRYKIKANKTMETNTMKMQAQDTDHVMKCSLGVWYSDDKTTGFKVIERSEKSTSIRLDFSSNKLKPKEESSKDFAAGGKESTDELVNNVKEEMLSTREIKEENTVDKVTQSQIEHEKIEIDNELNKSITKSSNVNVINAKLSMQMKDETKAEVEANTIEHSTKQNSSNAIDLNANEEVVVDPAENPLILEPEVTKQRTDDSSIANFVADHAAFFVALSIVNFTLAVLITLFCFVFPGAYEHIKATIGKVRAWTAEKVELGFSYGLEIPNYGMILGQRGTACISLPFNWMWRFLNCIGKCLGLKMPTISCDIISVHLPKLRFSVLKWFSCAFNCFKSEEGQDIGQIQKVNRRSNH